MHFTEDIHNSYLLPETYGQGLSLTSTITGGRVVGSVRNTGVENTPVMLVAAVYDGAGKMVHVEIDDGLVANNYQTVSRTFGFTTSDYPGCKFVVFAWNPDTYVPLLPSSQVN